MTDVFAFVSVFVCVVTVYVCVYICDIRLGMRRWGVCVCVCFCVFAACVPCVGGVGE